MRIEDDEHVYLVIRFVLENFVCGMSKIPQRVTVHGIHPGPIFKELLQ
jgi:hypothetical protein